MLPDPADALAAAENALRLVTRQLLGDRWRDDVDVVALEERRVEEGKRRDGATVNPDLLAYTNFYDLKNIIRKHWDPQFVSVFKDKKRMEVWLGTLDDVRNTIAHSRDLLPFERYLVAGASGQIRNLVAEYRTTTMPVSAHYPLIESATDNFGRQGFFPNGPFRSSGTVRIEVGDTLKFTCRGSDYRGRPIEWFTDKDLREVYGGQNDPSYAVVPGDVVVGDSVTLDFEVTERYVGEHFEIVLYMRSQGRHHRFRGGGRMELSYWDDSRLFEYAVNPPPD